MTRRFGFSDWQRVRAAIAPTQTRILARDAGPAESLPRHCPTEARGTARPAEGRPLHSHRLRSDEEWRALHEGVRALLAQHESSGRWTWVGSRRVIVG